MLLRLPTPLQTCVVVAIGVFGATLGAAFQCILLGAAFGTSLLLLAVFKPYSDRTSHTVGAQSLACLMLTAQGALVLTLLATSGSESTAAAATGVAAVVLAVNAVFVLSVLWRLLRAAEWGVVAQAARSVAGLVQRFKPKFGGSHATWHRHHDSLPMRHT